MFKRTVVPMILFCLAVFSLAGCVSSGSGGPTPVPTVPPTTPTPTPSPVATPVPFAVTSIDMAVNPPSIAGVACGTSVNVAYIATFHVPAHTAGGTVNFLYTVNNGRSTPSASITFGPGETQKTYTFNWSGVLSPDNVYPGLGGVIVTSPGSLRSPTIKPDGNCLVSGAFKVTSVNLAVNPTSIAGRTCGSAITLTYTATFNVAPNGPGGAIQFNYTTNNGRSQTPTQTINVAPGSTSKTYTFTVSGTLYADHTFPGIAIVMVTSPNNILSPGLKPSGQCV